MADNAARSRKAEIWRAEAGLQPLQLAVWQEVNVPLFVSQIDLTLAQEEPLPAPVEEQPLAEATPLATHLKQVSTSAPRSTPGQVPGVTVATLQLRAWAEATRTMAKMAT